MAVAAAERFAWVATESLRVACLLVWCARGVLLYAGMHTSDTGSLLKSTEVVAVSTVALVFASACANVVLGALDVRPWITQRKALIGLLALHFIFTSAVIPVTLFTCIAVLAKQDLSIEQVPLPVLVLAGCVLLARNWLTKIWCMVAVMRGKSAEPLTAYEAATITRSICADTTRLNATASFLFDLLELIFFGLANTFLIMQLFDSDVFAALTGTPVATPSFVGGELWLALLLLCIVAYLLACVFEAAPGATTTAAVAARPRVARCCTRRYLFGVLPLLLLIMTVLPVVAFVVSLPAFVRGPALFARAMLALLVVPAWVLWTMHMTHKLRLMWHADLTRSLFVQRKRAPASTAYGHPAQLVVDDAFHFVDTADDDFNIDNVDEF